MTTQNVRKHSKFFRLFVITLAVLVLVGMTSSQKAYADFDPIPVCTHWDYDFTWTSCPEYIGFSRDCDVISFYAECEDPSQTDTLLLVINDFDSGLPFARYPFEANGEVYTISDDFPAGQYEVYFIGDANIVKHCAYVMFLDT